MMSTYIEIPVEDIELDRSNPRIARGIAFFELSTLFKKRVIMTGTPVANRPYDIWAQIFFLDQGKSLGTDFRAFKKETDLSNKLSYDDFDGAC